MLVAGKSSYSQDKNFWLLLMKGKAQNPCQTTNCTTNRASNHRLIYQHRLSVFDTSLPGIGKE
jgi:hypothetical protein